MKILVSILIFYILPVFPQQLYEKQIIPFDGLDSDWFGRSVAVSDSFLFIGSLRYSNPVENAVYVYRIENNEYNFEYKLFPSDSQTGIFGALFGSRLLVIGDELFVGAQNKRVNNNPVGALYVFEYKNYKWIEKQKIVPPEPHTYSELFSNAISKYNDYLLVSAFRAYAGNIRSGKVFLYKYQDNKYELFQEFTPFDAKEDQSFGTNVIIKDDLIFIGSSNDSTESGFGSGSIYVYDRKDSLWEFSRKYIPQPNSANLAFGCAMALNNNYVFIGTSDNLSYFEPGEVYIYKYDDSNLSLVQIIESGDNYFDDRFGISLFANDDSLLVSAIFDSVKNNTPGAVYLFVNEKGNWVKHSKIVPSDEINTVWFGGKCIAKNDKIYIAAHLTKIGNIRPGVVYIYSKNPLSIFDDITLEPTNFKLSQNYPNPFNSKTNIDFYLPHRARIIIRIFNIVGQEIKTVLDQIKESNYYSISLDFDDLSSGIYFYSMEYFFEENNKKKHSTITKKAVLIK